MTTTRPATAHRGQVRLESLSRYDCWQLLTEAAAQDAIARIVWSGAGGPSIVPVNYAVADGFLWFQTAPDSRLARDGCEQRVLVEIDHVDVSTRMGWSVVVSGRATCLPATEDAGLLRDLQVWPQGSRDLLLKVEPDEVTGRRLHRLG